MRKSNQSVEGLLRDYSLAVAREINYPKNKKYPKERIAYEKELIKRLGGSWEEYCRLNDWNPDEV